MKEIFAIIVTYNGMQWIKHCIESLMESTVPMQIIVIDNNSNDGTLEFIKKNYSSVKVFPMNKNLGFGQANNVGISYALEKHADYCLLINQDAYLSKNAIELMLQEDDGESLLSPIHLNGNGSKLDLMFKYSLRNSSIKNTLWDDMLVSNKLKNSYEMTEICAACWFMPQKLIKKIGGFNPLFYHYSEDSNYYKRMLYHQVKTLLVPCATVCHDREIHGNIDVFNSKIIRRELLLNACDINQSFIKIAFKFVQVFYTFYITGHPKHRYKIWTYFKEIGWILGKLNMIINSRKKEKQIGKTWLQ